MIIIIIRWKIFQVLPLIGENYGENSINDVSSLLITNEEFNEYIERNKSSVYDQSIMVYLIFFLSLI